MENIFISNFKNEWWDALTYTQQVEYLKKYPNSKFKINKSILSLIRYESKKERALRLSFYLKKDSFKLEAFSTLNEKLISTTIIDLINSSKFNTPEQHDSWSESYFENWYQSLSIKEIGALVTYKSETYLDINDYLRGKLSKIDTNLKDYLDTNIKYIDSAIYKGSLDRDLIVYRGLSLHSKILNDLENKYLLEKSYLSVTTRPVVAANFYGSKSNSALIRIKIPKGSPVASLNKGLDQKKPVNLRYLENQEESELLLPRNSKLLVLSIQRNRKDSAPPNYFIDCDILFDTKI